MYNSFLSFIITLMLTRNSADARNCVQALIKYLQNLWLFMSAFNLTGTTTRKNEPALIPPKELSSGRIKDQTRETAEIEPRFVFLPQQSKQ